MKKSFKVKRTWSTKKFYEDFMWACKTYDIKPKFGIEVLEEDLGCPMLALQCASKTIEIIVNSFSGGPHYKEMMLRWRSSSDSEKLNKIRLLKAYLKRRKVI